MFDLLDEWKENYLGCRGAAEPDVSRDRELIGFDPKSEYMVNDPEFGMTFIRQTETGDIPYTADGELNHAMYARDL